LRAPQRPGGTELKTLKEIAFLASQGDLYDVLYALAERQDYADQIRHDQAIEAFDRRTDNPKASWGEIENAGVAAANVRPENPEGLIVALIEFARSNRSMVPLPAQNAVACTENPLLKLEP